MPPSTPARTRVEMTQVVLPEFTNALGTVFGGQILAWVDICAAVAAQRHCRSVVVTASIDAVQFLHPIKQGHVVVLKGQVNAAFGSSMECGVTVWSENPLTGDVKKCVKAYATFVALDDAGKLKRAPALVSESDDDRRRAEDAAARRAQRLANRTASAPPPPR